MNIRKKIEDYLDCDQGSNYEDIEVDVQSDMIEDLNEIDSDVERQVKEKKQLDSINDEKKFFYNFNINELIEDELSFDIDM